MAVLINAYNMASESSKLLASNMGVRRIRQENSTFKGGPKHTVINWGCGSLSSEVEKCKVLNPTRATNICSNKLSFFTTQQSVGLTRTVPFTSSKEEALGWSRGGSIVMARTILRGHSGEGIITFDNPNLLGDYVAAPLYTKYVPKKDEYRIHIICGEIVTVQRKVIPADRGIEPNRINWKIRNLANGFVFARNEDRPVPEDVKVQALNAFNSIGDLDFGSVDVIWNEYRQEAYVLEINTASGLSGSTVIDYANKFKQVLEM